jgi:hypothetical protein
LHAIVLFEIWFSRERLKCYCKQEEVDCDDGQILKRKKVAAYCMLRGYNSILMLLPS